MGLKFLLEFLRHPINTGAIAPSSRSLACKMVSDIDLQSASVVVEFGPGSGAFTGEILKRLNKEALFCVIENNAQLFSVFCRQFPGINAFEDSAVNVQKILHSLGIEKADCIVCGLPWASFCGDMQDQILGATLGVLREGGRFATFAYLQGLLLPSGQAFKRKLSRCFSEVRKSSIAWANLPPAFVYRCVK